MAMDTSWQVPLYLRNTCILCSSSRLSSGIRFKRNSIVSSFNSQHRDEIKLIRLGSQLPALHIIVSNISTPNSSVNVVKIWTLLIYVPSRGSIPAYLNVVGNLTFVIVSSMCLQEAQFWRLFKEERHNCDIVMRSAVGLVHLLAVLLEPFMPSFTRKVSCTFGAIDAVLYVQGGLHFQALLQLVML